MEKDNKAYAHAEKAYMQGTLFPFVKVGMQKVNLTPSVSIVDGKKVMTPNEPCLRLRHQRSVQRPEH